MTIPQFIIAYAVCWWLVLFMVLPSGAAPERKPQLGNAPSAPANPRLRRKFGLTTLLAILPTILIYFVATSAKAEEGMYHVGSGCAPLETYVPSADLATRDGYGVGDKKVASANLDSSTAFEELKSVDIPLKVPVSNYLNADAYNADMSEDFANIGELKIGMDGSTYLNGRPVKSATVVSPECARKPVK